MMLERVALTGKAYAGKTQLAQALCRAGYVYINYTDLLKKAASQALTAVGTTTLPEDILKHKGRYRAFLQELGDLVGFSGGGRWMRQALELWLENPSRPVVFDNVRTDSQFRMLQEYDFRLVEVWAPTHVRYERAKAAGVSRAELEHVLEHPIERGIDESISRLALNGTLPVEQLVREIVEAVPALL
jgi:dephospho-CoA kinase